MTKREKDDLITSLVAALVGDLADKRISEGARLRLRVWAQLVGAPWPAEG